jgi:hypothetical protein
MQALYVTKLPWSLGRVAEEAEEEDKHVLTSLIADHRHKICRL